MTNKNLNRMRLMGVFTYLCPEKVFKIRSFKGSLPCNILAVVDTSPDELQTLLLEKIMKALSISRFALMEIKTPAESGWIFQKLAQEKPAKRFLVFSESLTVPSQNTLFLKPFL